jgi:hypothetical protein
MASKSLFRRITAALGALDVADGPISRLEAARRLREAAEELETAEVEAARKAGVTWIEIGACYGLTKQGAQQRFRAVRDRAKAATAAPGSKPETKPEAKPEKKPEAKPADNPDAEPEGKKAGSMAQSAVET